MGCAVLTNESKILHNLYPQIRNEPCDAIVVEDVARRCSPLQTAIKLETFNARAMADPNCYLVVETINLLGRRDK